MSDDRDDLPPTGPPNPAGEPDPAGDPGAPGDPSAPASPGPGEASVPSGLVSAVVSLVNTGPVLLGAYTIAELTAVDAVVDFLEARPSDDELAEAVRSLAARELLLAGDGERVQVRGDLGIAVAFQQRARRVLDARTTGTVAGEPWRILLLPQPERICLMVRIDALGVHQIGLYKLEEAVRILVDWLPRGQSAEPDPDLGADDLLAGAERAALLTLVEYTAEGSAEIAGASTDLVLARKGGRLHLLTRDPAHDDKLEPKPVSGKDEIRDRLVSLLT
ncbi:collagen-like protein [Streptomyces sp. NPDC088194]|uniref:collagen-like triple helix repeat-containing protein n=1 Tax=Streptomyces sp. NPDC088194 TaxID=3154931 RepID=UPI00344F7CB5